MIERESSTTATSAPDAASTPGVAPPMRGRRFDPRAYRDPAPRPWLIHALGPVVRHAILRGWLKLRPVDFPTDDVVRLCAAVSPRTAAFLGPNHPEFMTDWMIDKEISRRCSPLMAHWAAYEIVNMNPAIQAFWLANNLIANAPGGGGREYSVRWTLAGHGVLLHPEGTATWQSDHIGPLVPGIVDMAWEACRRIHEGRQTRRTWIVPIVWRLHFTRDVGWSLEREMARIERGLGLADGRAMPLERRFAALQWNVLRSRAARFELAVPQPAEGEALFDAQERCAQALLGRLFERHGVVAGERPHVIHALRRSVRGRAGRDPEGSARDRHMLHELERLGRFERVLYSGPTLTQEQIAETLQQTRSALMTRGLANTLHNLVPVAVAPRALRIRVPEPIPVDPVFTADAALAGARRAELLRALRGRLQDGVDALATEIAPQVDPWRRPNPFAVATT